VIGVGIVGCGLIGRKRAINLSPGMELRACTDLVAEQAAALAELVGVGPEVVAGDVDELLCHDDVDLVIVATVHDSLPVIALRAVEAGKHVLVEKPGATSSAPLRQLARAAAEHGVVVRVGFNHRFHPAVLEVRDIVASGRFGPLMFIRARYGHGGRLGYEQEWRADASRSGGGELVDQGSHLVDLVRACFGDVDLAFAETATMFWKMDVEDNAFLALRPRSGGFAWLHASWSEWKNLFSFEVMLERAKLDINGLGGSYGPEELTVYEMQPELGPPPSHTTVYPDDRSWQLELQDVAAAIEGRPSAGATLEDAIAVLTLIEEVYAR
jgi:predicted dehydrogenase